MAGVTSSAWSEETCRLGEAVESQGFPCVVKACKTEQTLERDDVTSLPKDTTILLEKRFPMNFLRVKVGDFLCRTDARQIYGPEFVTEHDQHIGNEYLIPLDVKQKVCVCDLQGGRYTTVSQVMRDMPRCVETEEEVMVVFEGQCTLVDKGTKLQVVRTEVRGEDSWLFCIDDQGRKVNMRSDMTVNLSVVPDRKDYTLRELVDTVPPPKTVRFLDLTPDDVVNCETSFCKTQFPKVAGSLTVLGVSVKEVTIGWIRNPSKTSYVSVIIPADLCNNDLVYSKTFLNKDKRDRYLDRNFRECRHSNYLTEQFFLLDAVHEKVYTVNTILTRKSFDLDTDSDDSDGDYIQPNAPKKTASERRSKKLFTTSSTFTAFPISVKKIRRRISSLSFFNKARPSDNQNPRPVLLRLRTCVSESDAVQTGPLMPVCNNDPVVSTGTVFKRERMVTTGTDFNNDGVFATGTDLKRDRVVTTGIDFNNDRVFTTGTDFNKDGVFATGTDLNRDRMVTTGTGCNSSDLVVSTGPDWVESSNGYIDMSGLSASGSGLKQPDSATGVRYADRPPLPLPSPPATADVQIDGHVYDYVDVEPLKKASSVEELSLTADDFYSYTVTQVVECLRLCGLNTLAETCREQRLDGRYIQGVTDDDFTQCPFYLNSFDLRKLKQTICGWRPKMD